MLADSLIVPECIYRPGSFTGLMTIYESNFIKLSRLIAGFDGIDDTLVSTVASDCDLYFELRRREPYTTTFKLTYWFEEPDGRRVPDPDLTLRIYHDAQLVEAVDSREQHRHPRLQGLALAHSAELDRRWARNMLLNKWLDYLLDVGHKLR